LEKKDKGFVDHRPFEKGAEGQNAGALTTAATTGWARLGAEAQSIQVRVVIFHLL